MIDSGFECHEYLITCRSMWKRITQFFMLASKRLAGVTPEVKLGEHVALISKKHNMAAQSDLETQKRNHEKSKTGVWVK